MTAITRKSKRETMIKTLLYLRIFTVCALLVSGLADLYADGIFNTPVEQIGVGALAGVIGTTLLKVTHII